MKQSYPQVGDLVVVTITEVKNFGAKANLEEYRGKEGFIHIAEVATGWVESNYARIIFFAQRMYSIDYETRMKYRDLFT